MNLRLIDLHTHSTASDGTCSPAELMQEAAVAGLVAVALTDHDTLHGLADAATEAARLGVEFINGVEISAAIDRGCLHILGLHIDPKSAELQEDLNWVVCKRDERNEGIAQRLTALGMPLEVEEVAAIAGGEIVGRPHFARLMVERGWVRNVQIAFTRYLSHGGEAYVPRVRLEEHKAVEIIRRAGGVPVLAHPSQTLLDSQRLEELVKRLAGYGLAGLEIHYSGHTQTLVRQYRELATRYNLVCTGGSDYHGRTKPGVSIGRGPGSLRITADLLEPLAAKAEEIRRQG